MGNVSKVQGASAPVKSASSNNNSTNSNLETITLKNGHQISIHEEDADKGLYPPNTGTMLVFDDNGTPNNPNDDKKLKEYNLSSSNPIPVDINYYNHKDGHVRIGNTIFKTQDNKVPIDVESYMMLKDENVNSNGIGPKWFVDLDATK